MIVALFCLNQCGSTSGTKQADYYDLITYLFTGYKPEVRPTLSGTQTDVYIVFTLLSIQDLDEKEQTLISSVIFDIMWTDPWLTWNTTDYGDITMLRYPQKKLWLPDVVVTNSVESQSQLGYADLPLRLEDDGFITWSPTQVLKTSCDIDVTYYPFDTQFCSITLSTWVSYDFEINLDPFTGDVDLASYSKSGTWDLVSTELQATADTTNATVLKYTFTMRRLRTYYVVNIILPVLFLSFTASMVFYLPADAGEKMGMSITVLLAFAVYLTIIADNMPHTSLQTSIISVYMTMLLALTANGVVMSVLVLNMHHRPEDSKVGRRTTNVVRKIRSFFGLYHREEIETSSNTYKKSKTLVSPMPDTNRPPLGTRLDREKPLSDRNSKTDMFIAHPVAAFPKSAEEDYEQITWKIVGETIDRIGFVASSIFILVVTIVTLVLLSTGGG